MTYKEMERILPGRIIRVTDSKPRKNTCHIIEFAKSIDDDFILINGGGDKKSGGFFQVGVESDQWDDLVCGQPVPLECGLTLQLI